MMSDMYESPSPTGTRQCTRSQWMIFSIFVVACVIVASVLGVTLTRNSNENSSKEGELSFTPPISPPPIGLRTFAPSFSIFSPPTPMPSLRPTSPPIAIPVPPTSSAPTPIPTSVAIAPTDSPTASTEVTPAPTDPQTSGPTSPETAGTITPSSTTLPVSPIVSGSVGGVAYLHCDAQSEKQIDLVLLHGGSYTKEIWESNGLLDHFCSTPSMSVSALDLSTSAGHDSLQSVLDAMKTANLIDLPVALVTPSASGFTMINWMLSNDPSQVTSYIATWVPIATGSLTLASDTQVVKTLEGVRVLAIYGDRDTAGGKLSQRLGELVNATVVELVGGHPVYLHSPNEFVDKIVSFLRL